jgi:hypothetical protein
MKEAKRLTIKQLVHNLFAIIQAERLIAISKICALAAGQIILSSLETTVSVTQRHFTPETLAIQLHQLFFNLQKLCKSRRTKIICVSLKRWPI